ncbi:IclR family transcriptional regulator [Rhodococcus globerulus]|uniref:IclR family transcriptional regulator n=1 Tax=Rhodococcus globerulus TaxID=33008 RepID=UPI000B12F04B|nr:IclR family transcriptional regulator [Rhodococcus globerulus]
MTKLTDEAEQEPGNEGRRRQPLARGIEILTFMIESEHDSHGVRELAGHLGVSPSTAHRLVTDLEKLGLMRRAENGSYRLGLEFLRLAWTTTNKYPLQHLSAETLNELMEKSGESAFFSLYSEQRHEMMFTLTADSSHPLRYTLPMRQWLPLHAGASGLAILAFLPKEVRHAIVHGRLTAATNRTLTDPDELLARLDTVHRDGYSITHGERIEGAIAIAAPVFGRSETVVGAVGITLPEARLNATNASTLVALVREAAGRITELIAGTEER